MIPVFISIEFCNIHLHGSISNRKLTYVKLQRHFSTLEILFVVGRLQLDVQKVWSLQLVWRMATKEEKYEFHAIKFRLQTSLNQKLRLETEISISRTAFWFGTCAHQIEIYLLSVLMFHRNYAFMQILVYKKNQDSWIKNYHECENQQKQSN